MGRIKGAALKALVEHLITSNPGAFSADFVEDKKILDGLGLRFGKTEKNKLAGEIAAEISKLDKMARKEEEEEKLKASIAGAGP